MKLKIEYLTPEELQPYANNAKLHPDAQIKQIANSIEAFEFSDPIGIWGDNEVVEGHGRLLAALQLGLKEVPVIRLDHLTDEQRRAYMLVHNQTTMTSGWDADKLLREQAAIDINWEDFGFNMEAFAPPAAAEADQDLDQDEWDDVEKLDKHYGVPYQGNKSRIADIIVSVLPAGNRLVDLFGGGGHNPLRNAERQMALFFI